MGTERTLRCLCWLGLLLLPGIRMAAGEPAWWGNPVREDSLNLFFPATGVSAEGEEAAFQAAMDAVWGQVLDRVGAAEDGGLRAYARGRIAGGAVHAREHDRGWRRHQVWLIYRLPKEEVAALSKHLLGADARYEAAVGRLQGGAAGEALAMLRELEAEYPLGEQPVFRTERATMHVVDCLLALGRPQEALETCRRLLARAGEAPWRQAVEERMADLESRLPGLLAGAALGGIRLRVEGRLQLGEGERGWDRLAAELAKYARSCGAEVVEAGGDGVLVAEGGGVIEHREKAGGLGEADARFRGKVVIRLELEGREPFHWEKSGLSGWNPMGEEMCLDVVALQMFAGWQADWLRSLEGP